VNWLAESGLAAVVGVVSALLPFVNAEAYALLAAGRTHPAAVAVVVLALAAGQTAGKLVLFEAARRGSGRWHARLTRRTAGRAARWGGRGSHLLTCRRTGLPTVLVSASVGVPPLALVSLAAGAAGQVRWEFGVLCLVGRVARFALVALPVAYALR
jgi:membrane protein YqaA with SNARE-associated domain